MSKARGFVKGQSVWTRNGKGPYVLVEPQEHMTVEAFIEGKQKKKGQSVGRFPISDTWIVMDKRGDLYQFPRAVLTKSKPASFVEAFVPALIGVAVFQVCYHILAGLI